MGVDLCISFECDKDAQAINDMGYDLARRLQGVSDWLLSHPCLAPDPGDDNIVELQTLSRWWGPDYERGDWPNIRTVLAILLAWQENGRIGSIWHHGDNIARNMVEPWTQADTERFDKHFASGHWSYRWSNRGSWGPSPVAVPLDAYGKPMRRHGGNLVNTWAVFSSDATNESLRFHHDDQCTDCGSADMCYVNTGHGKVDDSETIKRSAIDIFTKRHIGDIHIRLTAFRCAGCGRDHVLDSNGVTWTLDASDYQDKGSFPR